MPLALSDPSSGEDLAAGTIASGSPTTFGDNLDAAWNASRLNDRFVGSNSALEEAYDSYNDQVFKSSGVRLPNPARGELPPGMSAMDVTGDPRIPVSVELAAPLYEDFARKQGATPPTLGQAIDQAHAAMRGAEANRNDMASRSVGLSGDAGQFLGSAAAISTDPPVLASMLFGGGAASTVLRAAGREALVAGATELAIQPQIQADRVQAGLPGGFVQGAENVAMAAGGAAGLTGLFRGAGAAYGALRRTAQDLKPATVAEADAAAYAERYAALQEANPLVPTPEAAAEHIDRVSAAQTRHYDPSAEPADTVISDVPRNAVREQPARPAVAPADVPAAQTGLSLGQQLAEAAKTSEGGLDAFMRSRAMATELVNGGTLEDVSLDLARGPKPVQPADDPSLVQFVINRGGINDADRSLAQANITPRDRPGLMRRTGLSTSQMSELAQEAGFFPKALPGEGGRAVDQRELATAIRSEIDGQKLYARHGGTGNPEARATFDAHARAHGDLNRAFSDLGLDPRQMSNEDIRDAVNSIANAPDPVLAQRSDYTSEAIDRAARISDELDAAAEFDERAAIASENDLRAIYANRMDEPVYIEINGEVHAVPAREVFKALEDDDKLVKEFGNCINGVPF